jgi:hypothetical protein
VLTGKGGGAGAKTINYKVRSCYSRSVRLCMQSITRHVAALENFSCAMVDA